MSVFLGTIAKGKRRVRDVIYNSEGHISVCAGPGSYKTMSVVCPLLIRGIKPSTIVLDPSRECGPGDSQAKAAPLSPSETDRDAKHRFFASNSRELPAFVAMCLEVQGEEPTLPAIFDVMKKGVQALSELYAECKAKDPNAFEGALAELARSLGIEADADLDEREGPA